MTLDELNKFNGKDLMAYQTLLDKRDKLDKAIRKLYNKIQDEDDSLSVFEGELNEHDLELFNKHVSTRNKLYSKVYAKEKLYECTLAEIQAMQR